MSQKEQVLWERLPGETPEAYGAFCVYRDLGPERGLDKAYRASKGRETGGAPGRWNEWSRRWTWLARAEAYDDHLDALEMALREKELKASAKKWAARRDQLQEQTWDLGQKLLDKAAQMLRVPIVEQKTQTTEDGVQVVINPTGKWGMRDAAALVEAGTKLARLATGQATETTDVRLLQDVVMEDLTDEQVERIANGEDPRAVLRGA